MRIGWSQHGFLTSTIYWFAYHSLLTHSTQHIHISSLTLCWHADCAADDRRIVPSFSLLFLDLNENSKFKIHFSELPTVVRSYVDHVRVQFIVGSCVCSPITEYRFSVNFGLADGWRFPFCLCAVRSATKISPILDHDRLNMRR